MHRSWLGRNWGTWEYWFALTGIILYNNWVLAIVVNPHATWAGATTSELGVQGQPWANMFRTLDVLAGLCFLLGIGAIIKVGKTPREQFMLRVGMLVLGISTISESILRLSCSSALNKTCAIEEHADGVDWQHTFHIAESVISYALLLLLPLAVYWALRGLSHVQHLQVWSKTLLAVMIIWFVESIARFAMDADAFGYEQRGFIIVFSVWFVLTLRYGNQAARSSRSNSA